MFHLLQSLPPLIGPQIWRKGLLVGPVGGRSNDGPSFAERMSDSLDNVARSQNELLSWSGITKPARKPI